MPATRADRQLLRSKAIERRLALAAAEVAALSAAICGHLQQRFSPAPGRQIGFFWPVKNEPDLRPTIAAWRQAGAKACLPVVTASDAPLTFRAWTPATPMNEDRYGIPTPAEGEFVTPDTLLLPLNAFDASGYRIGYGGGFFDRTLAASTPRPLAIGVGFELARVASVVPQAHDQPLDWIVTEAGVFRPAR
jgi:5,10-methenyltetrahydrofolate synthetase